MIISQSRLYAQKHPEVFDNIYQGVIRHIVSYIIDSKYRKSLRLSPWILKQVNPIPSEVIEVAKDIPDGKNNDETMINILKFVRELIYHGDLGTFKMREHWNTIVESLTRWYIKDSNGDIKLVYTSWRKPIEYPDCFRAIDCEDGMILIYGLARAKGISENRLWAWAGDVQTNSYAETGGHACLFYRPDNYPYNFIPIDWCYYPTSKAMNRRNLLTLFNKEIIEEDRASNIHWSNYQRTWFIFNEKQSMSYIKPKSKV